MKFEADCFRAHDPRWAFEPLSGAGAARQGGRFNRQGLPALYLSLSAQGALDEASQGFSTKIEPLTICAYDVACEDILDLRTSQLQADTSVLASDLACDWIVERDRGQRPASWSIADRLIAQGAAGILVPSFARHAKPDAANLVLWRWGPALPHKVTVHDPQGRLPVDQRSWPGT